MGKETKNKLETKWILNTFSEKIQMFTACNVEQLSKEKIIVLDLFF